MTLRQINIHSHRNIEEAKIEFGDRLNIFFGENGSGKSSVLEAIYMLSSGKSFRSRQITKIIKENKNKLTLFGKLAYDNKTTTLGLERSVSGYTAQINGETIKKFSALAKCLPVLIITQDSHKLLEAGPQWRREFIDWGLFHVEQDFMSIWSSYRKLIKNRNQALSNKAKKNEIQAWDQGLASYGEIYSDLRQNYVDSILTLFQDFSEFLLRDDEVFELKYKKGWPKDTGLLESLSIQYERDKISGRTACGPHRGEFSVSINGRDAKDHVSRGQQKLLVYALYFAQVIYLKKTTNKDTLILLDDLGAELDIEHTRKLLTLVSTRFSQVCITTANLDSLPLEEFANIKMFHVKQGNIESVNPNI